MTCTQTNVIWVIKSRRMGWAGYVARMGKNKGKIGSGKVRKNTTFWFPNLLRRR